MEPSAAGRGSAQHHGVRVCDAPATSKLSFVNCLVVASSCLFLPRFRRMWGQAMSADDPMWWRLSGCSATPSSTVSASAGSRPVFSHKTPAGRRSSDCPVALPAPGGQPDSSPRETE